MQKIDTELKTFLEEWPETPEKNRAVFLHCKEYLEQKENITSVFIPRPGITYSLRVGHSEQKRRNLFAMIDVIEDTPRWLSVCFYAEMITDPERKGDEVPGGLLGEDAVCFDIEAWDEERIRYIEARLDEACLNASKE